MWRQDGCAERVSAAAQQRVSVRSRDRTRALKSRRRRVEGWRACLGPAAPNRPPIRRGGIAGAQSPPRRNARRRQPRGQRTPMDEWKWRHGLRAARIVPGTISSMAAGSSPAARRPRTRADGRDENKPGQRRSMQRCQVVRAAAGGPCMLGACGARQSGSPSSRALPRVRVFLACTRSTAVARKDLGRTFSTNKSLGQCAPMPRYGTAGLVGRPFPK